MICKLVGTWIGEGVDVGGVGYAVDVAETFAHGAAVDLYVHTVWRDTGPQLYGFSGTDARDLFVAMCKVNRVGPAMAMSVLRTHGVAGAAQAIRANDAGVLARSPGVGRKSAELLCMFTEVPDGIDSGTDLHGELVAALVALGYDQREARNALQAAVHDGVTGEDDLLRTALATLGGAA